MRFYGFSADEIADENDNLNPMFDPKYGWAIKHPEFFPVEISTADAQTLLRVPGIGFKSAYKIIQARKFSRLDFYSLYKLRVVLKRAEPFITCNGKRLDKTDGTFFPLLSAIVPDYEQISMFSSPTIALSALDGQL